MPTEMNDEVKQELLELEQRLRDKGVVDVKFSVDRSDPALTAEKVAHDMCEVLNAYLDGNSTPVFGIGDSSNPATIEYFKQKSLEYEKRMKEINEMPNEPIAGLDVICGNSPGEKCPKCGAEEIDAYTSATVYACASYDYDQRPGTFKQSNLCFDLSSNEYENSPKK